MSFESYTRVPENPEQLGPDSIAAMRAFVAQAQELPAESLDTAGTLSSEEMVDRPEADPVSILAGKIVEVYRETEGMPEHPSLDELKAFVRKRLTSGSGDAPDEDYAGFVAERAKELL